MDDRCSRCHAVIGDKHVGPGIEVIVVRRHLTLCAGCAVSVAESLYAQVRSSQIASALVVQRVGPDLRDLARGMK